jgi:hypothetical protein
MGGSRQASLSADTPAFSHRLTVPSAKNASAFLYIPSVTMQLMVLNSAPDSAVCQKRVRSYAPGPEKGSIFADLWDVTKF